jgi:hypothetical protein
MKRMFFEIYRPSDDGLEKEYLVHHRCEGSRGEEDVLVYWPFAGGMGMPTGVPWYTESEDPCGNCGAYVGAWFAWKSSIIIAR